MSKDCIGIKKIQLKMPSGQSLNFSPKTKKIEERKIMEKLLEEEKVLGISLRTKQIKILHAIYAKGKATQRKIVGSVICHNATIARSSGT